jgi:hypothetical protein
MRIMREREVSMNTPVSWEPKLKGCIGLTSSRRTLVGAVDTFASALRCRGFSLSASTEWHSRSYQGLTVTK